MMIAHNGRSHLLLNRERKEEAERLKEFEKLEKAKQESYIKSLEDEVERLKTDLQDSGYEKDKAEKNREILKKLYDRSIIDEDGNVVDSKFNH
jgi:hypothetical protein